MLLAILHNGNWVVTRLVTGRVRAHSCVRETCVRLHAAWGVTICRSILPCARGCRVGVWFGFVRAAVLPAVGTCVVLAFGALPGRCCFLRVTQWKLQRYCDHPNLSVPHVPESLGLCQSKLQSPPVEATNKSCRCMSWAMVSSMFNSNLNELPALHTYPQHQFSVAQVL